MVPIPAQVGSYRVLDLLGAGAMGSVFKAQSAEGRIVALKMIGGLNDTLARFRPGSRLLAFSGHRRIGLVREARLAMELTHPNIVHVLDYGQHNGLLYLVMEFLEGQTLLSALRNQTTTVHERLRWMSDVGDALAFAHHRGVIHRDLHAGNVLVLHDQTVKVLDFGLARRANETLPAGEIAGPLLFLAPELLRGKGRASSATDIRRLGALLHFVAYGSLLRTNGPGPQLGPTGLHPDSSLLDSGNPCAGDLRTLVGRALESDPQRGLASAREFAAEVRRIAAAIAVQADTSTSHGAVPFAPPTFGRAYEPLSPPVTAEPATVSVRQHNNRARSTQRRLAQFDMASYLKRVGFTTTFGLMLFGYMEPTTPMPGYALAAAVALALLPIVLLFPANLVLSFAAALVEIPRCRSCRRAHMRLRREVAEYALDNTAISLGIADGVAALQAGLWDDAGQLLSLHGHESEPLQPRKIAEAPLRLHLKLFVCRFCLDESAIFTVQEHREDRWNPRPGYVKAYRNAPSRAPERIDPLRRLWQAFVVVSQCARVSLSTVRISVVQCVCGLGLLFVVWFTWAYLHRLR